MIPPRCLWTGIQRHTRLRDISHYNQLEIGCYVHILVFILTCCVRCQLIALQLTFAGFPYPYGKAAARNYMACCYGGVLGPNSHKPASAR